MLLLEDERSDWVNPIFDEREKWWRVSNFVPNAAGASTKIVFQYFRMGQDKFWYIPHNINLFEFLGTNHFLLI